MENFEDLFRHYPQHRVIICKRCRYAPIPNQLRTHLRVFHARIPSEQRDCIVQHVQSLSHLAQSESDVVYPLPNDAAIPDLPLCFDGLICPQENPPCQYICRTEYGMKKHLTQQHSWVNKRGRGGDVRSKQSRSVGKPWNRNQACQRFFKTGNWQRYFAVATDGSKSVEVATAELYCNFFREQEADALQAVRDVSDDANRVRGFEEHSSSVVPWLRTTGIIDHVRGLKKDEMRAALALPSAKEEIRLQTITEEMDGILQEAHSWCFDGPECMLTWPCRVVLSRFQSSLVEAIGKTRPFDPNKEPRTLSAYFKLAKQLMVYVDRVAAGRGYHFSVDPGHETQRPEDAIDMSPEQLQTWHSIDELAQQVQSEYDESDSDDESDDESNVKGDLRDELVKLWMLLICHHTGSRRYSSPLLSFCAMLSIKPSTSGWMEPGDFNSHLSGIIWVVQLLIFYDSARKAVQGRGDTLSLVKDRCERYMQQTVETPMGEILRWRLLLFRISRDSVSDRQAEWDETEQTLTYEGAELRMDQIPTLLKSEYDECRRILYDDLMFGLKDLHQMHAWALKDNPAVAVVGWDLTQHPDNVHLLRGSDRALLSAIERSPQLCRTFVAEDSLSSTKFVWRESALASYELAVQAFLQRLCVLIHVSGGQPLREPEFLSMTWRNTQRPRSITIRHERIMVHVKYHKGQQQTGRYKDNIRFLAHPISNLLLDYIVYVQRLRQLFLRHSSPKALITPFLWEKDGKLWPSGAVSRFLEDASVRAQIPRLHISNWRQMTVAIVKTKFAAHIGCFEADEEDEDAEEMEENIRAMTRQRNHKTQTVNRAYANQTGATFGNVWDGLIRMGLRASTLWQDFWGVDTILQGRKRGLTGEKSSLTKRVAMGVYRPRKLWSAEALRGAMRKLYGGASLDWKSIEQEQALTAIMSWKEQVVAILPTGAGKSLLFMLPCTLPDAGVTVVVVPLVSLRGDLLRRVKELGIDHLEWLPGEKREAALLFVSVEAASTKDFLKYARSLVAQQKLDRIVVDECHLTATAAEYRPSLVDLTTLRCLPTQFVYLTATLPPSLQAEFEERNYLLRPTTIRASSNRSNIFYMVRKADARSGSLLEQGATEAWDAWEKSGLFDHSKDKIVLYVRLREEAGVLARLLACNSYTAESGSPEEKAQVLVDWIKSPHPFIVATTALAEGFDYAHVRLVININEPESLVIFAQESGRAGRDGQRAYSLVLLPSTWKAQSEGHSAGQTAVDSASDIGLRKKRDRQAVHRYLQGGQCYRTSLSEYLDAVQHRRWCMPEDVACDICTVCHEETIPPRETVERQNTHTGLSLIQQAQLRAHSEMIRYREDLAAVCGTCLLCRATDKRWDHVFAGCPRRHALFQERKKARLRHEEGGRQWLQAYTVCFWCFNPQSICRRAEHRTSQDEGRCEFGDIVLPLCYGVFHSIRGPLWLKEQFGREFTDVGKFFDWLGEESLFGGQTVIQAVRVAAESLAFFRVS